MAKKSRRARRRRATAGDTARTGTAPAAKKTDETGMSGLGGSSALGLAEQYAYVYGDLKRIAIIAGTLLAALVVLSFVIN